MGYYESRIGDAISQVTNEANEAVAFSAAACHEHGVSQASVTLRCFHKFHKKEGGKVEYEPTAEWSRIQQALKERDELAAELERTTAIKNQVVENCNEWRGVAQDRTEELEIAAGHISDTWLYLDAWARSDSVTIEDVKEICKTILKKQLAPGWVPVERDGE